MDLDGLYVIVLMVDKTGHIGIPDIEPVGIKIL